MALCSPRESLLVDLCGDQPAILGQPDGALGISDWLVAGEDAAPDALQRLERAVSPTVNLLCVGTESQPPMERADLLVSLLANDPRNVIIDAGTQDAPLAATICAAAEQCSLVLRPCYLALRRAKQHQGRSTGVILLQEPGRSLRSLDVSEVLDLALVAEIQWDPAVARAVDAGLLSARVPRSLAKVMAKL